MIDTLLLTILLVTDIFVTLGIALYEDSKGRLSSVEYLFHSIEFEERIKKILKEDDKERRIELFESELRIKDVIKNKCDEQDKDKKNT